MKNIYKSLIEAILITTGLIGLAGLLGFEMFNPILDGILFFSVWGKSYQYYRHRGKSDE